MRLTNEQLEDVKKKYNVDELWSYSRISKWSISKYEWFLSYVLHEQPQNTKESAYAPLGSAAHDLLEQLYNGEIKESEMANLYDIDYSTKVDLLGYKFNKEDEQKNKEANQKYYDNMMHFFKNYKMISDNSKTEVFIPIKINDDIVIQGYIDFISKDKDGNYFICDFKTSTKYVGKAINEHATQLILYSEGLHQMGVPIEKIKCGWCFLKYVTLKQLQMNDKWSESAIERRQIGEKVQYKAKSWMKKLGYDEITISSILNEVLISNDIDCFPDDLKEKFIIEDCYIYVDNWHEQYEILRNEIINTVADIKEKIAEYELTKDDKLFYDDDEHLKQQEFYLRNLSDYSINQLRDFRDYLNRKEEEQEMANDLLGVTRQNNNEEDDLSWLKEL